MTEPFGVLVATISAICVLNVRLQQSSLNSTLDAALVVDNPFVLNRSSRICRTTPGLPNSFRVLKENLNPKPERLLSGDRSTASSAPSIAHVPVKYSQCTVGLAIARYQLYLLPGLLQPHGTSMKWPVLFVHVLNDVRGTFAFVQNIGAAERHGR